ncbi:TOBE domain-containing protein [Massilia horti]|uniref:Mop domain-containing protein n=1 Tax=Massilia horti TaxID=2562153 RepID=A0A4Y9STV2_9BURK|nr:TOBE domain-containing protein [Massilia horti]TFW30120.1 hypothetical protein E4O92_17445 [Massilia horti]
MKTSARNQFPGKVASINPGAVNDEIELETAGGQKIVAMITHASAEHLGMFPGCDVVALVPPSSVVVVTADEKASFSARNRLAGTVSRIQRGSVNSEVTIALAGGLSVSAVVTNDGAASLDLAPGQPATAIFKASSVILAVTV